MWLEKCLICVFLGIPYLVLISSESELLLVHALFRHGERTVYRFYPNDPYINETFYPIGVEGLTNNGKLTMYHIGEFLRKEYGQFLGQYYTQNVMEARSTGMERTIMTAQLILSGLWQPVLKQKWHPTLNWLPIPVHSKHIKEEDLLEAHFCKRRNTLLKHISQDTDLQNIYLKPHQKLIKYVEKHSGLKINELWDLFVFFWALKAESDYGLTLPKWTNEIYPESLRSALQHCFESRNIGLELKQIQAGYYIKKLLNDSIQKVQNTLQPKGRKMFLYVAHDTTIGYLLSTLNVTKPHMPEYGSGVILELHRIDDKYFLKWRYIREATWLHFEDLSVPGCEVLCPLTTFKEIVSDILPTISYAEACQER